MRTHLPVFAPQRRKRACFFSLHPRDKAKKFSAYAPKAMLHFTAKYDIPVVENPADIAGFDVVFFSLHCFRDFYLVARMAHYKRPGQEWIAGSNACATPAPVGWIMDYVWVGDCRDSFGRILAGERDMASMYNPRYPERPVRYIDEDLHVEQLTPTNLEMSKGCPRRCLFCIHPWRHRYQEQPKEVVVDYIKSYPKMRLGLISNSSDDVSYYEEVSELLYSLKKHDMTVSNAVQSYTEEMAQRRTADMLFGVEGMSERLRWIVNKPIPQGMLREKVDICLKHQGKVRLIYQFNLPGETEADFAEFESDVRYWRNRWGAGQVALTFIPNQPSAHTPFQWVVPRYNLEQHARLMEMRASLIGSGKRGLGMYLPTPLGARGWFAQVIAEWIPVTPAVDAAVAKLPQWADVPTMLDALAAKGVKLPPEFLTRDASTVFPWSNIITTGDDSDKWKRFANMQRKLSSPRFLAGPNVTDESSTSERGTDAPDAPVALAATG